MKISDYIEEQLLESAIQANINYFDFWNLTIKEAKQIIEIENEKKLTELKWQAQLTYINAMIVGQTTSNVLSGKSRITPIEKLFPSLFKKPHKIDWRIAKDRLLRFAENHNSKRGE